MTEYEEEARKRGNVELDYGAIIDFHREGERQKLVAEYAWAIPSEEALQTIAAEGPIVEIGAGNGYWAWELEKRGVDILAYDPDPYEEGQFVVLGERWEDLEDGGKALAVVDEGQRVYRRRWAHVYKGDHTVAEGHGDRSLFICWPTWGGAWATEAVEASHADTVLMVGELGGCTGDEGLVPALARDFKLTKTVEIPRYWGVHDSLTVWRR